MGNTSKLPFSKKEKKITLDDIKDPAIIGFNELAENIDKNYTEYNKWTVIRDLDGVALKNWI